MKDGGILSTMTYYWLPEGGGELQHNGAGEGCSGSATRYLAAELARLTSLPQCSAR